MPRIPNFPQDLLVEHRNWHNARHKVNTNNPPPGYGLEFLRFHRDFVGRALAWYRQNGLDPSLVEPWVSVPEEIRNAPCYDQAAEARILFQPESFATADELGRFIESSNMHACIHQQSAQLYGDGGINDFDMAPSNTVFYNIHGMVDRWWRNWEGLGRFREEGGYWCGRFEGEDDEILLYSSLFGDWWLGKSRQNQSTEQEETRVEWEVIGESRVFGEMTNERQFRIWDVDEDGKLEVLFRHPLRDCWIEGKVKKGRIAWRPVRLQLSGNGLPSANADPAKI
ncbi:tyrosinase family protein [Cohnella cholangitidis]|uniref:Tyrosinase copper-binding domain-containing protein n=1 Tax=Cohnella cholangitidis TaxID=2598458 RepID=A0A7G5C193_9BACL|nr:tyrosinase family protein [Cohnella cholangitidis]QMV42977.1 hypothetical protein FPL14_18630 [Cohnella cholangitidis]